MTNGVPERLNGYPVREHKLSTKRYPDVYRILVEKDDEWVVATWSPLNKTEWVWGHYFDDEASARKYYNEPAP